MDSMCSGMSGVILALTLLSYSYLVNADTVVILGGEVDSLLHPSVASVETIGPCGVFQSGIPELPKPRRNFAAALYGSDLVICGGHSLLGAQKECLALDLDAKPFQWRDFPPMNHGRELHGLVTVGSELFAVGGSQSLSQKTIEKFDGTKWEDVGETDGYRQDFCALPWKEDGIIVTGGYDDFGSQTRTELYNTTTNTWTRLHDMDIGRGQHGCAYYEGGVAVGGGWTLNLDPDVLGEEVTRTSAWYDPINDKWTDLGMMDIGRTKFGLETINGTLTAIGGWEGLYTDSIEQLGSEEGWDLYEDSLPEEKAAFGVVKVTDLLEDENCN